MDGIRILIEDRNYESWKFYYCDSNIEITENELPELKYINPIEQKLFSRDVFLISKDNDKPSIQVIKSLLKTSPTISGVLQLEDNKTFGRTDNKKRLLYKCIPDDKHLPIFLVPYDIKLGFVKSKKNKYVVFKFDHWKEKHPHGILVETLGDVNVLEVFYEYQLYCRSLYHSITDFTKKTRDKLNQKSNDEYLKIIFDNPNYNIEDRRKEYVFTIDPLNSLDFDDGFSIKKMENQRWKVSVYIANVYFWLETLGLWNSFSKRVATIYLPDRRRPMLPTILSDSLCSLQQNQDRFALAMDFVIDEYGNIVDNEIQYKNVFINVKKNYVYNDPNMLSKDKYFIQLYELSTKMDGNITDSYDVVSHWMILMNTYCGSMFVKEKMGIFRCSNYINTSKLLDKKNLSLDDETFRVVQNWNNSCGQYLIYNEEVKLQHELMNLKSYTHITSPIRRLIDLLNHMLLMQKLGLITNMSYESKEFLHNWITQIDYLNTTMRSIRKIQIDCNILQKCFDNPEIMNRSYKGVVFDKILRNDGYYIYMVYLNELKLLSRITTPFELNNYKEYEFDIYLFEDEDKTKKKIRLQIKNPV